VKTWNIQPSRLLSWLSVLALGGFFSASGYAASLYQFTIAGVATTYPTFTAGARASCSATYPDDGSGWICPAATCGVRNTNGDPVPTTLWAGGQAQCFALQEYPSGTWNPAYQTWVNAGGFTVVPGDCPSGYVLSGSVCVAETPCPEAGTDAIPSGQIGYGESPEGSNPVTGVICGANQCAIQVNAATAIPIGGGLQANYITSASYTGSKITGTCPLIVTAPTPNDPTLPKPLDDVTPDADTPDGVPNSQSDCPPGSAFGQVNGVNVCAPSGSKIAYQPDTSTQTGTGGDYSSTTKTTDTVNSDGTVTRSSSTTTTGPGGGSTTTTNNTNVAPGSGDKSTPNVTLGPAPPAEGGDAPTVAGIAPGSGFDGAGKVMPTFSVGSHFSASNSCIADRSVNALGMTLTIPLSELCPYFEAMYNLVSLFAVFAALRILVMA